MILLYISHHLRQFLDFFQVCIKANKGQKANLVIWQKAKELKQQALLEQEFHSGLKCCSQKVMSSCLIYSYFVMLYIYLDLQF